MNTAESTATPTNANAGAQAANAAPGTVTAKKAGTQKKNAPKAKKGANKAKPKKAGKVDAKKGAGSKPEPREGSKKQIVIEMLGRNAGATMAEIAKETGWQNHSIRGFVSIIGKNLGVEIASFKNERGERCYRIEK